MTDTDERERLAALCSAFADMAVPDKCGRYAMAADELRAIARLLRSQASGGVNSKLLQAIHRTLIELWALCVTPANPRAPEAFPQLENAADKECITRAIEILISILDETAAEAQPAQDAPETPAEEEGTT